MLYGCVGMVGARIVAVNWLGVDPGVFVANIERYLELKDFWMGITKAAVFGFLISAVSCSQGFYASGGARGVGLATTRAVVRSSIAILITNYFITDWLTDL